jgi:H+-transporting ATPase
LAEFGKNEIPVVEKPLWKMLLDQFTGAMPFMLELCVIISASVKDWVDFGVILAMLVLNSMLGLHEELKAKAELKKLTDKQVSEVVCNRDGVSAPLPVTDLVPGDLILLSGGNLTPADVEWLDGDVLSIDTAALTGEPLPRKYPSKEYGKKILGGTTVKQGEAYARVLKTGINTEIGAGQAEIAADRQTVSISEFERKVLEVVKMILVVSVGCALAILLVQGLARDQFQITIKGPLLSALVVLIAAIPVALPLVLQVTMAIGAGKMATEHHTIVTRISALQDIASMEVLCSDKTGTLTTAKMSINLDKIYFVDEAIDILKGGSSTMSESHKRDYVMAMGMLAANADKKGDAIDGGVIRAFAKACERNPQLDAFYKSFKQDSLTGFNPEVKRTVATLIRQSDNKVFYVAKGLATKILDTSAGGADSADMQWTCAECAKPGFTSFVEKTDEAFASDGYKTIAIAVGVDDGTGKPESMHFAGLLPMIDPPRHDTAVTIERLVKAGGEVKMITGDHLNIAKETARLIGMNTNIQKGEATRIASHERDDLVKQAGGFAQVLPKDKRECVQVLQKSWGYVVGMTGDGVNDAPALSAAQCGIAVDDATDAAKNAAAMILTSEGLSAVYGAVVESRKIAARLQAYVSFRLASTIQILIALTLIILVFNCEMNTLYVILLALMNDLTMIPIAEDRQTASKTPMVPNVRSLLGFALVMGLVQAAFTLIFYTEMKFWVSEDHLDPYNSDIADNNIHVKNYYKNNPMEIGDAKYNNMLKATHGANCNYYAQNALWLQISISAELLIFVCRAPGLFFFSMPSLQLLFSTMVFGVVLQTLLAMFAFPDGLTVADAFKIWAYDIVVMFLCDFTKLAYKFLFEHASSGIIDESQDFEEDGEEMVDEDEHANRPTEMGKVSNQVLKTRDVVNRMSTMGTAEETTSRVSTVQRVSEFITEGKVRQMAPPSTGGHYISQQVADHQIRSSIARGRSASKAYNA